MSLAKAKIHARLIFKGKETIEDISIDDRPIVRQAYRQIYGVDIPE